MPNSSMALPLEKKGKIGKSADSALFFGCDFLSYVEIGRSPMGYSLHEVDHG